MNLRDFFSICMQKESSGQNAFDTLKDYVNESYLACFHAFVSNAGVFDARRRYI